MNQPTIYKQVIVMRHDLKMRRGKQIAQGAHASMSFLCHRLRERGELSIEDFEAPARAWLSGAFAKVCCRVDSEEELMAVYEQASEAGLETHLITDSGKTEFHGVPTRTCIAIGPDLTSRIDAITGELSLL
ncbi:MAG: aminoacyl-tRNA hydrolase [Rubripirellula sp.]